MSYFGNALTELLERKQMTALRLSEISRVDNATISRLKKGDQVWISPADIAKIAAAISEDPRDRAGLIKAHLLDECNGPGSELIEISIRGVQELRGLPGRNLLPLARAAEENFLTVREWYNRNPNVSLIVDNLAELLRESTPVSETDSANTGQLDTAHLDKAAVEAIKKDMSRRRKPDPK